MDSGIKDGINPEAEKLTSNASHLITTKQFLEAYAAGYDDYELKDLYAAAARILKVQMYQLYRLVKTSHALKHKVRTSFISQTFYNVNPDNFKPESDEIELYVKNPRVIFRYSTWNHNAICGIFEVSKLRCAFSIAVKTYNNDFSQIMPYIKSKYLSDPKKSFFKQKKDHNSIDLLYVKKIFMKYFKYKLKDHECIEYLYSDDFFIHGVHAATTYINFVCAILTGSFEVTTDEETHRFNTNLWNSLCGVEEDLSNFIESISNDTATMGTYKLNQKEKKIIEKKEKELEKQSTTISKKKFRSQYKNQLEDDKEIKKVKKYKSPDDFSEVSIGDILKSGFDSISSDPMGRIARKNTFLNRGVSIASKTVDTIHRQAMRGVERSFRLKRKRFVIFGDETEAEVNSEYEDQAFLRSYISECPPDPSYIPNGANSENTSVSKFKITDYVGTKVYPYDHPIVEHLTCYADNAKKSFNPTHPYISNNLWLNELIKSDTLGFYSFIVKLLGDECKLENTEIRCNFGTLILRIPWKLPVPAHRAAFIEKGYSAIIPCNHWNPATSFNQIPSLSDKKREKLEKALKSWIDDYHRVFDTVDDANRQQEREIDRKRKMRAAKIETAKYQRVHDENAIKSKNKLVCREIDHVINEIKAIDNSGVADKCLDKQFESLFRSNNQGDIGISSFQKITERIIDSNATIPVDSDQEENDNNSVKAQCDFDIENEVSFTNSALGEPNIFVEKQLNKALLFKEQYCPQVIAL